MKSYGNPRKLKKGIMNIQYIYTDLKVTLQIKRVYMP